MMRFAVAVAALLAMGGAMSAGAQDPPRVVPAASDAGTGATGVAPAKPDAHAAQADPRTLRLSLRQSLHLALNHNVDIEISRYQPWIEDQNVLSSLGAFDHIVYSSLSFGENESKSGNPFDTSDIETDRFNSTVGVRRVLPFGLSYDLSFRADRSKTNAFFSSGINPAWNESLTLALAQPLLKGRGTDAQYTGVIVARHGRQAAVERFEKALTDQLVAVHQAYWDLVFARENLEVKRQSEKVAERLLEENQKKFEKGVLARVDVTEAESGVAAQREGILTAENAVASAVDKLKRLVDPALLKQDIVVVPIDAPQPYDREMDEKAVLEAALAQAFARRPEYREFAPLLASQDQSIRKAQNDLLPKLDLTASGALTGLDDSFGASNKEVRGGDFHDWSFGVVFEWPFERRAAQGALNRAELERRRLGLQRRSLEDQILVEVRAAVRDVKTTEKRIEATRRARVLAQERFEGEMNRREAGLRTTFHVLDAEERLTEARTNEIKAVIDYNLALMTLFRSEGTLLERSGVLVQDNLAPRLPR